MAFLVWNVFGVWMTFRSNIGASLQAQSLIDALTLLSSGRNVITIEHTASVVIVDFTLF